MPEGTWKTTGSGPGAKTLGLLAGIGAGAVLVVIAAKSAAATFGDIAATSITAGASLAAGIGATLLVKWLRGRRGPVPTALWKQNPNAIPARPRRELPAPVVTVNIDAGLLAGLMNAMQPQPVRGVAESVEQHQEIQR